MWSTDRKLTQKLTFLHQPLNNFIIVLHGLYSKQLKSIQIFTNFTQKSLAYFEKKNQYFNLIYLLQETLIGKTLSRCLFTD